MGNLWDIAQAHLDQYGVRAAALARRMGTSPQTLDSWKNRGIRNLPTRELLEALARETRTPYLTVLEAALQDSDYLPKESDGDGNAPPINPARDDTGLAVTPDRWDELAEGLRRDGYRESAIREAIGDRPGEVQGDAGHKSRGQGDTDRRRTRTA